MFPFGKTQPVQIFTLQQKQQKIKKNLFLRHNIIFQCTFWLLHANLCIQFKMKLTENHTKRLFV